MRAYEQDPSGLAAFVGSLVYGMADSSRAAQIQAGMEYYKARRKEQQEIKAEIEALE
ncbi:MAG: hypothetical protein CLLPBCKN_000144 [Chroococcidiopsis cubana SAG 39.79]|jgi:ABC-type transporter MlaC component|uniref:Uncharacterized protein n=1 Tax=Chroococcidiopsis cubana SAG 39.79 TaxID=388085 RepID=A0AB37UB06_9CYAN|nr:MULTISPECIES: hypothetical protein [Chroococcidiopsis]MDZ4870756.1 hypothetical protein [Chroococcidiopsis cubana SAG 39.79]RUT02631.1 hypothetical protein DSM107010_62530 [Chroococcidiopsis cubana SAG 39.79]URD48644.1 hypothetical protein M5J74_20195 [Chroococcidiopsis sp. CCNUC1]